MLNKAAVSCLIVMVTASCGVSDEVVRKCDLNRIKASKNAHVSISKKQFRSAAGSSLLFVYNAAQAPTKGRAFIIEDTRPAIDLGDAEAMEFWIYPKKGFDSNFGLNVAMWDADGGRQVVLRLSSRCLEARKWNRILIDIRGVSRKKVLRVVDITLPVLYSGAKPLEAEISFYLDTPRYLRKYISPYRQGSQWVFDPNNPICNLGLIGDFEFSRAVPDPEGKKTRLLRLSDSINDKKKALSVLLNTPRIDFSDYGMVEFDLYPVFSEPFQNYSIDINIWSQEIPGKWRTIKRLKERDLRNKTWNKVTIIIKSLNLSKVLRPFEIVVRNADWPKGAGFSLYVGKVRFLALSRKEKAKMLFNGGFERGRVGWNDGRMNKDSKIEIVKEPSGNHYLKYLYSGATEGTYVFQEVAVKPATWYRMNARVKATNCGVNRLIQVDFPIPPGKKPIHFVSLVPLVSSLDTSGWINVSRIFRSPSMTNRMQLQLLGTAPLTELGRPSVFCVDDIELKEIQMRSGEERIYQLLGSLPRDWVVKFEGEVRGSRFFKLPKPLKTVQLAIKTVENSFKLNLIDSTGKKITLAKILPVRKNRKPSRSDVLVFDGKESKTLEGFATCDFYPTHFRIDIRSGKYMISQDENTSITDGPFDLPDGLRDVAAIELVGEKDKISCKNVFVGGPLYEDIQKVIDERRAKGDFMRMEYKKGKHSLVPESVPSDIQAYVKDTIKPVAGLEDVALYFMVNKLSFMEGKCSILKKRGFDHILVSGIQQRSKVGGGGSCDIGNYYKVGKEFADSPKQFKDLIKEAHQSDMKVFLWIITMLGASPDNPFVYKHPEYLFYDEGMPYFHYSETYKFDERSADLWRDMAKWATFWVNEYDLDGYAIDGGQYQWFRYFKRKVSEAKPGLILYAESSGGEYGTGLDVGWHYFYSGMLKGVHSGKMSPKAGFSRLIKKYFPQDRPFGLAALTLGMDFHFPRSIETAGVGYTRACIIATCSLPGVPVFFEPRMLGDPKFMDDKLDANYAFVSEMLLKRRKYPVLRSRVVDYIDTGSDWVVGFDRKTRDNSQKALVLINFSNKPQSVAIGSYPSLKHAVAGGELWDIVSGKNVEVDSSEQGRKYQFKLKPYQGRIFILK